MAGRSTRTVGVHSPDRRAVDGIARDQTVRVISVYATNWRHPGHVRSPDLEVELGWLREFYHLYRDQLPSVLTRRRHVGDELEIGRATREVEIIVAETWLFALPFGEVVAALTLEFRSGDLSTDAAPTVTVLEHCERADITVAGATLAQHVADLAGRAGATLRNDGVEGLPPERHQVVFAHAESGHAPPDEDQLTRILYTVDPPYRQEFMDVERPSGLNQKERTLGAVTPHVSLLYGHKEYVENSIFLTTVQAVGAAARFRHIWYEAYGHVRKFRDHGQAQVAGVQRREDLEELVDELGNLQLDLSFSVETSSDLGLLIPSLRIESFHRALYKVLELPTRAETVSKMFTRLDGSIRSEITAIEIRERREEQVKRLRGAIAASVLSIVGVPVGFLTAFFGINATEVEARWSMFDLHHYLGAYVVAACLAMIPVCVFLAPYGYSLLRRRFHGGGRERALGVRNPSVLRVTPPTAGARTGAGR